MVAEHLIALIFSGRNKHKSDNANMSNYKFCLVRTAEISRFPTHWKTLLGNLNP